MTDNWHQQIIKINIFVDIQKIRVKYNIFFVTGNRRNSIKMLWQTKSLYEKEALTKMCLLKNFQDIFNNRTFLFIIVLLSLKLCSPQDLNEEFVNDDSLDTISDIMVVPVKRLSFLETLRTPVGWVNSFVIRDSVYHWTSFVMARTIAETRATSPSLVHVSTCFRLLFITTKHLVIEMSNPCFTYGYIDILRKYSIK